MITLGLLRNFIGISILNYLLLTQSVTNVTIALLFIPFTTLILECLFYHFKPNKSQNFGILASSFCVIILTLQFNQLNHIAWYHLPLTLLASIAFSCEAIILKKINQPIQMILFWQNLIGASLLFLLMIILNHSQTGLSLIKLPPGMYYWIFMVSLLSIIANKQYIQLTKCVGASISTQINIMIVILGIGYDALFYGSAFIRQNLLILCLAVLSTKLILHSDRQIEHHT